MNAGYQRDLNNASQEKHSNRQTFLTQRLLPVGGVDVPKFQPVLSHEAVTDIVTRVTRVTRSFVAQHRLGIGDVETCGVN